jgi:hypothetical protein
MDNSEELELAEVQRISKRLEELFRKYNCKSIAFYQDGVIVLSDDDRQLKATTLWGGLMALYLAPKL